MTIGGVVEGEALAPVEDRHGGRELVEGARVGVHLPRQVGAHALEFRQIRGLADRSARAVQIQHIHEIAASRHHRVDASAPQAFAGAR